MRLNNVTIAYNIADSAHNGSGDGGGLYNGLGTSLVFYNTLIAGNIDMMRIFAMTISANRRDHL